MRILADENIPVATVQALRGAGHDVWSATERARGASDADLAAQAVRDKRIVLTFDQDFGELCVQGDHRVGEGVILLRFVPTSGAAVTDLVVELLARTDVTWTGYLSVVTQEHIRQRPL